MTVSRIVHALVLLAASTLSGCSRTQEVLAVSALSRDEGAAGGAPVLSEEPVASDFWSGSGASCVLMNLHDLDEWPNNGSVDACDVTGEMAEHEVCSLLGQWRASSDEWLGMSTDAMIDFHKDGTFSGSPEFSGEYCLDGTDLAVAVSTGTDMTCAWDSRWTVMFTADCANAVLCPRWDNCTGARRYLHWNVALSRP